MEEDDYHIYQVPRPTRSQSLTASYSHPIPFPIAIPQPQHDPTIYTHNQVYAIQLPVTPRSAPPSLPPYFLGMGSRDDSEATPQVQLLSDPEKTSSSSSSKKHWLNGGKLPRFGSLREKSRRSLAAAQGLLGGGTRRHTSSDREQVTIRSKPPLPGSKITLGQLAENHAHSFPFQARAVQSYSFQVSQLTPITNCDVYNLLLVKHQQCVSMKDRLGISYTIPLNSAVQFGYINSSDKRTSPHNLAYKSYTRVADLLALSDREMPRMVCAQHTFKGHSEKCSVEENEILLVLQIRKMKVSGKKYLKMYSFKTKSKKSLYPDCVGHFTTNPAHLHLWLTDMESVHASILPCQAVIYLEKRFTSALKSFPSTLLQADSFVTLTELKMQKSIVASLDDSESGQASAQSGLLDIPLTGLLSNLQFEVHAPHDTEALHVSARTVYDSLDVTSLQPLDDGITDRAYNTKCMFYSVLRKGSELVGVKLVMPKSAFWNKVELEPNDGTKTAPDVEPDSDSDNERYEKISDWVGDEEDSATTSTLSIPGPRLSETASAPSSSLSSSGFHSLSLHDRSSSSATTLHTYPQFDRTCSPINSEPEEYELVDVPDLKPPTSDEDCFDLDVLDLKKTVRILEDRIVPLERKVAEHQQLKALVRSLSTRIKKLEKQLMPHSQTSTGINSHSSAMRLTNIAHLCSLEPSQVSLQYINTALTIFTVYYNFIIFTLYCVVVGS